MNNLSNIAKRRKQVMTYINEEHNKELSSLVNNDKNRLAFKAEKGTNNWSRCCQDSGKQIRRPIIINNNNINDLLKLGYKFNNETKQYEYLTKDKTLLIPAIIPNEEKNEKNYYVCTDKVHGENKYIGFLSKANNPYGLCMPCCYKNNQGLSNNESIKKNYNKCM
jgi:hypothetical protein